MFKGSTSGVKDRLQEILEELAEQLYRHRSNGQSLFTAIQSDIKDVSEQEGLDFKKYWLAKHTATPRMPQLWEFKEWIKRQDSRKTNSLECSYYMCDGSGYIELYEKKLGHHYTGRVYEYIRACKCMIGEDQHDFILQEYFYSHVQIRNMLNNF